MKILFVLIGSDYPRNQLGLALACWYNKSHRWTRFQNHWSILMAAIHLPSESGCMCVARRSKFCSQASTRSNLLVALRFLPARQFSKLRSTVVLTDARSKLYRHPATPVGWQSPKRVLKHVGDVTTCDA